MRVHGLLFVIAGFLIVGLYWNAYTNNISFILSLDKLYIYIILFFGLIFTVLSGIMIGMGIKILINPVFYTKLKAVIKE